MGSIYSLKEYLKTKKWTLFTPSDTPDLHDLYGMDFEKRYEEYEAQTQTGEIQFFKEVDAKTLEENAFHGLRNGTSLDNSRMFVT